MVGLNAGVTANKPELALHWDTSQATVHGKGIVQFADTSFVGVMQAGQLQGDMKTEDLVSSLIQTVPELVSSTAFIAPDGAQFVRTIDSEIVALLSGERVVKDDVTGNITVANEIERRFYIINAAGERIR